MSEDALPRQLVAPDELPPGPESDQQPKHSVSTPSPQQLIIVSNRGPASVIRNHLTGETKLTDSTGGLVSALLGVKQHGVRWVSWVGDDLEDEEDRERVAEALKAYSCRPVWMNKTLTDLYYNGFCNVVLWQLFHYVPVHVDHKLSEARTLDAQWEAYTQANKMFAEVTLKWYNEGDIVWIHDYHLMLVPKFLKAVKPSMKVGFFLHTPFPSSEIYRTLPYREELLRGVLKADLIGFHTYDYARHFISSCTRILGLEGTLYGVEENGSLIRVTAFPIGIDPGRFQGCLQESGVVEHRNWLKSRYEGKKVMLGVDRLDMIKGIPQKLLAFEKFLEEAEPALREQVVLIQIAVPSRVDVPEYQQLRSHVHEIVGRINGRFGTLTHVPIHHLDRSLSFKELCALYSITDVALITSLRDGMNLVSYEFVSCQQENHGVLVLSEFAGAAQSLGAGSLLVNPWNVGQVAQQIATALKLSPDERYRLWKLNFAHISVHTTQMWADHFITELNETCAFHQQRKTRQPLPLPVDDATLAFRESRKKLIVLGYNAVLTTDSGPGCVHQASGVGFGFNGASTPVGKARMDPGTLRAIRTLAADPGTDVVITSGTTTHKLAAAFADEEVWLAAENGVYLRPPRSLLPNFMLEEGQEWLSLYENLDFAWVTPVNEVLEYFSERTPRSFVERRDTSVVWNYKLSDYEFGKSQAQDMLQHLLTGSISNTAVEVLRGSRSVEVRMFGVNKGRGLCRLIEAMSRFLGAQAVEFEFVLCIGHFLPRDESAFLFFEGEDVNYRDNGSSSLPVREVLNDYNPPLPPTQSISPAIACPRRSSNEYRDRPHYLRASSPAPTPWAAGRGRGPGGVPGPFPHGSSRLNDGLMGRCSRDSLRGSVSTPRHSQAEGAATGGGAIGGGAIGLAAPGTAGALVSAVPHPVGVGLSLLAGSSGDATAGDCVHRAGATARLSLDHPPEPTISAEGTLTHRDTYDDDLLGLGGVRSVHHAPAVSLMSIGSDTPNVSAELFPPRHLFTVTVGGTRSVAQYRLEGVRHVTQLLSALCPDATSPHLMDPKGRRFAPSRGGSDGDVRAENASTTGQVPFSRASAAELQEYDPSRGQSGGGPSTTEGLGAPTSSTEASTWPNSRPASTQGLRVRSPLSHLGDQPMCSTDGTRGRASSLGEPLVEASVCDGHWKEAAPACHPFFGTAGVAAPATSSPVTSTVIGPKSNEPNLRCTRPAALHSFPVDLDPGSDPGIDSIDSQSCGHPSPPATCRGPPPASVASTQSRSFMPAGPVAPDPSLPTSCGAAVRLASTSQLFDTAHWGRESAASRPTRHSADWAILLDAIGKPVSPHICGLTADTEVLQRIGAATADRVRVASGSDLPRLETMYEEDVSGGGGSAFQHSRPYAMPLHPGGWSQAAAQHEDARPEGRWPMSARAAFFEDPQTQSDAIGEMRTSTSMDPQSTTSEASGNASLRSLRAASTEASRGRPEPTIGELLTKPILDN